MGNAINLQKVCELFDKKGYKYDISEYINTKAKMTLIDKDGYKIQTSYERVKIKDSFSIFGNGNPYTVENINLWLKKNYKNMELIDKDYISNNSKMEFKCLLDDCVFESTWVSIQSGTTCPKCKKDKGSPKRYTLDLIKTKLHDLNPNIVILNTSDLDYQGNTSELTFKCLIDETEWVSTWQNIKNRTTCPVCDDRVTITIDYIKQFLIDESLNYELLSNEYINNTQKLLFRCLADGELFERDWASLKAKKPQCPICSGRLPVKGVNTIEITHPHMIDYFVNKSDAYSNTFGSDNKVLFKCLNCGSEEYKKINDVLSYGYSCGVCSKNRSYGERYMFSFLRILGIEFKREYRQSWSLGKKYDFYLPKYNVIIETHGIQHYKESKRGRSLKEEQENDKLKYELAIKNDIDRYIVIDCSKSNFDFINKNVIESELNQILDVNEVDVLQIKSYMNKSIEQEIYQFWNTKEKDQTTKDVSDKFNISQTEIRKILNFGASLGLCIYDGKEEMKNNAKRRMRYRTNKVICLDNNMIFDSAKDCSLKSELVFGFKMNEKNINAVCNGGRKHYKGFKFEYMSSENKEVS